MNGVNVTACHLIFNRLDIKTFGVFVNDLPPIPKNDGPFSNFPDFGQFVADKNGGDSLVLILDDLKQCFDLIAGQSRVVHPY